MASLRRIILLAAWPAAAVLLAVALSAWWLLGSEAGRDRALERVIAALPGGALRIGEREGSLAGGLRLRDVVFENAAVRVEMDMLQATPRRPGFDAPSINLARLQVRGVRVLWKDRPKQATPPWPELLPKLELPISVRVDAFDLRDLRVGPAAAASDSSEASGAPEARVDRLAGALSLSRGRLSLASLVVEAPQGRVAGRIDYAPAEGFATRVELRAALADGARLALQLEGDPGAGRATLEGEAGGPLSLTAEWRDGPAPGDRWGSADAAPGLRIALAGRVARDGVEVQLRDSRLRLHGSVLHAEPLALSLLDGRLEIDGRYGLDDERFELRARAEALAWGEGEARVQAGGQARVAGTIRDWHATLDLDLARGAQAATLVGEARGDAHAVVLAPFVLATPGGVLEGEGRYALDAGAAFALKARMRGLDPAWLVPGWPGQLDGRLVLAGNAPSRAPLRWRAEFADLRGTLRQQAVGGRARFEAEGDALRIDADLALGDGRIAARGALAPALSLDATLRGMDIGPWVDGARGAIDGELRLRGSAGRPAIDADLVALDAGWAGITVQRLVAKGRLPARGDGRFDIAAEGLAHAAGRVEALELTLEGALGAGRYRIEARGIDAPNLPTARADERAAFSASGDWQAASGFASGELGIAALDVELPRLPAVLLAGPARVVWSDRRGAPAWRLPQAACLAIGDGGRLCAAGDAGDLRIDGRALDLAWAAPFLPDDTGTALQSAGLVTLQATHRKAAGGSASSLRIEAAEARIDARAMVDAAGVLDGEIALRATDLGFLEVLSTDIVAPRGVIDGRLQLSGSVAQPRWRGAVSAAPLALELPALGIAVIDGELRLEGDEDGQLRLRGRLPTGDGSLELAGRWSGDGSPSRLSLRGTDVRVLDTPEGRAWASPDLELEILKGVASLRGRVDVPRALLHIDRFAPGMGVSPDVVVVDDAVPGERTAGLAFDADFILALGDAVRVQGYGLDGSLGGELRIRDRLDRVPRARGTLELSGELRAYGQRLDIERGTLRWGDVPIDEPSIDLRAVRPDSRPEVGIIVTGTGNAPVVDVWSRPPLPQAEALSWLMFGQPLAAAGGEDAARLQQAATSLGASVVAQAVAGRIGLDAANVGESRALGGTALTVGKRVTPRLFVSYGMAFAGTGQVITVTFAIRRWLALKAESGLEQRIELEATIDRD